jgi:lipopolysaccharide/colanic/teichoic acid biosynthesis glycosyltransferase
LKESGVKLSLAGVVKPIDLPVKSYRNSGLETQSFPGWKRVGVKRAVDFVLASALMLVAAPIIAVLAILVKRASTGPAFYSQARMGLHGRPFRILKLRTMFDDCESVTGPVWSCKNDERITPIGRILRDTHLDELPQLWNVLRGDMSLVGPRPERAEIARRIETKVPEFALRLRVKPGVTGLAQLRVPADVDISSIPHKLAQDLYYLRHQSLLLDLRILISTGFSFVGAGCACMSEMLLAGSSPSVEQEMEQPEITLQLGRHTKANSISEAAPELSIGLGELAAAA